MQAHPAKQPAKPVQVQFEFVVGSRPDQLKIDSSRKLRSFLSKRFWEAHRAQLPVQDPQGEDLSHSHLTGPQSAPARGKASDLSRPAVLCVRGQRRAKLRTITFECVPGVLHAEPEQADPQSCRPESFQNDEAWQVGPNLSMDAYFGGIRVDPFRSYPGPWQPHIPALADHYITHMARDIPELDQPGNKGLLRSRWFPLVISDAAPFRVVMLLSAANYASVHNVRGLGCHILHLKHEAIRAIDDALRHTHSANRCSDDFLIGAVAKMASYEAMHGDVASYRTHMEGLVRMLATRGGLHSLAGLGGLLRRMIVWIDLNASFLLDLPRYFPGTTFTGVEPQREVVEVLEPMEPNPERFIAV
ncbi:hypothetical protein E4U57_005718 [Claviceps arundinis]|uniref:Uncharacterized protein n=1 Tax=Claviceps arundinis TaxID=1623583 RepID=A0A9P7STX5_9HYPO|nr:hypothetical protein E4U57_005718 [Claviceps arundinis]KAG5975995.1 hypothetical protein E4U56_002660 [Claviceps arundinis]